MADSHAKHLGSQFRLEKIRSIKQSAYIIQWLAFIMLALVIVYLEGFSVDPLHVPLGGAIYYLCIVMLVMIGEGIAFTLLEARFEVSESERYLNAKKASNRAILRMFFAFVVGVLVILPPVVTLLEDSSSVEGTLAEGEKATFSTASLLGLSNIDSVELTLSSGTAEVFVVTKESFDEAGMDPDALRLKTLAGRSILTSNQSIQVDLASFGQEEIVIVAYSTSGGSVSYHAYFAISSSFRIILPIFALVITFVNFAWFVALIPIKRKYKAKSVYA